ncbi:hypothetical protein CB1_000692021 [Camelus ferus]|nr:hypothetical protein CB1_000692021 [Camelus ferus]
MAQEPGPASSALPASQTLLDDLLQNLYDFGETEDEAKQSRVRKKRENKKSDVGALVASAAEPALPPGPAVRGQRSSASSFFQELREELQCAPAVTPGGVPPGPGASRAVVAPSPLKNNEGQVEVVEFHSRNKKRKQKPDQDENPKVSVFMFLLDSLVPLFLEWSVFFLVERTKQLALMSRVDLSHLTPFIAAAPPREGSAGSSWRPKLSSRGQSVAEPHTHDSVTREASTKTSILEKDVDIQEFNLEKARLEVHRLGITGYGKGKERVLEQERAIMLGAKARETDIFKKKKRKGRDDGPIWWDTQTWKVLVLGVKMKNHSPCDAGFAGNTEWTSPTSLCILTCDKLLA